MASLDHAQIVHSQSFKMPGSEPFSTRARTKIVATVGPASEKRLKELVDAGVDVFRLNTAHGSIEERSRLLAEIRAISDELRRPIGVLCDLAGPKIRLKNLVKDPLECKLGDRFRFVRGEPNDEDELASNYEKLIDELNPGDSVKLADGVVSMRVLEKLEDSVLVQVDGSGILRSKQGINLPGVKLSIPSLTEKDRMNAVWAAENDVEFVSLSFVRQPDDIFELKQLLADKGSTAWVIAKIEKSEAVDHLEEIVKISDGIMVARGDLGVEIDIAQTPIVQKRLVALCHKYAKPVIVATQMLDSMQHSSVPTRAEVTDVANAILDGTDACMLSGETAIGQFPVEAVQMMNRVALATEPLILLRKSSLDFTVCSGDCHVTQSSVATAVGAASIAQNLGAKLVVVSTKSGALARVRAKQQNYIPTVAVSGSIQTLRRLALLWGVIPLWGAPEELDPQKLIKFIDRWGVLDGCLVPGDKVVYIFGKGVVQHTENLVLTHEVESV